MNRALPKHLKSVHRRNNTSITRIIQIMSAILVVLIIVLIFDVVTDISGSSAVRENTKLTIPAGSGINTIAEILKTEEIIKHPIIFKLYVRLFASDSVFQQGEHELNGSMGYAPILEMITQIPQNALADNAVRVTIPEGWEIRQIADLLSQRGLIDREMFMHEIENGEFNYPFIDDINRVENRLEGYLYPNTYDIARTLTEHDIISMMLKSFNEICVPIYNESGTDMTLDDVVIMASIIEREAKLDEERPTISSVFYNRLDISMPLQSCATVQYILKERKAVLSNADTQIESRYNTYKYLGMPVGPIASVGKVSFMAALHPADTEYLYFVANADDTSHTFSKTLSEHNRATKDAEAQRRTAQPTVTPKQQTQTQQTQQTQQQTQQQPQQQPQSQQQTQQQTQPQSQTPRQTPQPAPQEVPETEDAPPTPEAPNVQINPEEANGEQAIE